MKFYEIVYGGGLTLSCSLLSLVVLFAGVVGPVWTVCEIVAGLFLENCKITSSYAGGALTKNYN